MLGSTWLETLVGVTLVVVVGGFELGVIGTVEAGTVAAGTVVVGTDAGGAVDPIGRGT